MNRPVVILGCGGHARVIADALTRANRAIMGWTGADDCPPEGVCSALPYLGGDDAILALDRSHCQLAIGIGNIDQRRVLWNRFSSAGYHFTTVQHPAAVVGERATIADGCQLMAGSIIQADTCLGKDVIVNTNASADHDCLIGDHVHLAPGSTVCGGVTIGHETFVGPGATVTKGLRIGARVTVGAGAVVITDVHDDRSVFGVPAREKIP